jgi:hypothetical protein
VVEAVVERYADRTAEQVERLAHHAVRGEVWAKAVTYLRQAGVKAFARSANRESVAYLEQARAALSRLPDTRERREQAIDLLLELRTSLYVLGELPKVAECLREADEVARRLNYGRRRSSPASWERSTLSRDGSPRGWSCWTSPCRPWRQGA